MNLIGSRKMDPCQTLFALAVSATVVKT